MAMSGGIGGGGWSSPTTLCYYCQRETGMCNCTCFECLREKDMCFCDEFVPFDEPRVSDGGRGCYNCGDEEHTWKDCKIAFGRSDGGCDGFGSESGLDWKVKYGFGESTGEGRNGGDQKLSMLECAICFEKYNSGVKIPKVLKCGHTYCEGCIRPMIKYNRLKCPTCREVSIASAAGFPKNYALLSLIDEEETRAKSFKYNCKDCAIGLTMDTALKCKGDHAGVICLKCYSTNHGDHGGIDSLHILVDKNRPGFDNALQRLKQTDRKYKSMEYYFSDQRQISMVDSWINRLLSMNDSVTTSMDSLRTEMDEIKRVLDEDDARLLEKLTISGRVGSFADDSFGNAKCYGDLEFVRDKFKSLEAALSEKAFEEKQASDNRCQSKAHMFRPYLDLMKSRTDGGGSGDQGIAGASTSNTAASSSRPIQAQIPPVVPFTYSGQDFRSVQGGEGTSGRGGFGGMSGAIASSSSIRGGRGRGYSNRGRPSAD